MKDRGASLAAAAIDVCTLFGEFLLPPPHEHDVNQATPTRAFVVNRQAGLEVCSLLDLTRYMALPGEVQVQIMSLLHVGLSAGHCSAVRLRLSCESGQLVRRLLELLKGLAAAGGVGDGAGDEQTGTAGQQHTGDLIQLLSRVLGMVCSAGVGVDELKGILHELRAPSASTLPLLGALSVMVRSDRSCNTRKEDSRNHPDMIEDIFDFGGDGAGLVLPVVHWPFAQEYQIAAWVRVEQPAGLGFRPKLGTATAKAHLVTLTTEMGAGIDYFIQVIQLHFRVLVSHVFFFFCSNRLLHQNLRRVLRNQSNHTHHAPSTSLSTAVPYQVHMHGVRGEFFGRNFRGDQCQHRPRRRSFRPQSIK